MKDFWTEAKEQFHSDVWREVATAANFPIEESLLKKRQIAYWHLQLDK